MFNKYYQDELSFLREMGQEFSKAHPEAAHFFADRGSDPDVERLLEGFAFLTGRIRQKLDDELPELTHTMMGLLWPHYLRPIPSMTILEFEPKPGAIRQRQRIPRGTEMESLPVEGTRCRFRTCFDVDMYPLSLAEAELSPATPSRLRLRFQASNNIQLAEMQMDQLRLHLHGDPTVTYPLYLWLSNYVRKITLQSIHDNQAGRQINLPLSALQPVGFSEKESLLSYPQNSFPGFRLLQEYFTLPSRFLFFDLGRINRAAELEAADTFEIVFEFSRTFDGSLRVGKENILLNCTPVANLFPHQADPLRVEHNKVEYRIRPSGPDIQHYEIYSVEEVFGWKQGTAERRGYKPFFSFAHSLNTSNDQDAYYQTRLRPAVVGDGTDAYISFVTVGGSNVVPETETISLDLMCTNRRLPTQLRVGDINAPTSNSPEFARFRNITRLTPSIPPPLTGNLHWRLISHLSLNYLSLNSVESLRGILELYNFRAVYDRQAARANQLLLEGIHDVQIFSDDRLFHGAPIRGITVNIGLQEDNFTNEGAMYLFSHVLNEFLALYATLNAFTQLTVKGVKYGEIYQWPPRLGQQILL